MLNANGTEGIVLEKHETKYGVNIKMTIKKGYKIPLPVHLCFGLVPKDGLQEIKMDFVAEEDSAVELIAHCTFPNAVNVVHKMDAQMLIGKNASLKYTETHFHDPYGGIQVIPKTHIKSREEDVTILIFHLFQVGWGIWNLIIALMPEKILSVK